MIAFPLAMALALAVQAQPAARSSGQAEVSRTEAEALLAACGGRRFETPVEIAAEGKVRRSKVKLCGTPGQSDADWIRTLEDAVRNVDNSRMPPAAKEQVIAAIRAEIARLLPATPVSAPGPALAPAATTPPAAGPVGLGVAVAARPRLSVRCFTPGERGKAACSLLTRESLLIVRAEEGLGAGHRLRFVRRGDVRSELALGAMARGKSVRLELPEAVCAGVGRSRVDIQLIAGAAGPPVQTIGPIDLRC